MFCPQCGQERFSTETSFCSRCGYLLTGTADLLLNGGLIPQIPTAGKGPSERSRGVRQGIFIMLTAILVVPVLVFTAIAFNIGPALPAVAMVLLIAGGILRIAYAMMFQSADLESPAVSIPVLSGQSETARLPHAQSIPVTDFGVGGPGRWRTTSDLEPHSVTDGTTKLLD
jgi:hypothetical protein